MHYMLNRKMCKKYRGYEICHFMVFTVNHWKWLKAIFFGYIFRCAFNKKNLTRYNGLRTHYNLLHNVFAFSGILSLRDEVTILRIKFNRLCYVSFNSLTKTVKSKRSLKKVIWNYESSINFPQKFFTPHIYWWRYIVWKTFLRRV